MVRAGHKRTVWPDEEKLRILELVDKRDRATTTVAAIARAEGCSTSMVAYWAARRDKLLPLTHPALQAAAVAVAVKAKGRPPMKHQPSTQLEIALASPAAQPAALTQSERDELVLLRAEVGRYRRMIAASMMTEQDLGGTAWATNSRR